jgi:hypothetical protein
MCAGEMDDLHGDDDAEKRWEEDLPARRGNTRFSKQPTSVDGAPL